MTSLPPPALAAIPPCLRRTLSKPRTARRALAFLGFILAYIALPLALIAGIYALNALATGTADRVNAYYQQTHATYNATNI